MDEIYLCLLKKLAAYGYQEKDCVMGAGNRAAQILLIGEAPGKEEVKSGMPFVGKAGKNLDEFLAYIGIERGQIYITNVVKFRPFRVSDKGRESNRPPSQKEIAVCAECLAEEIRMLCPKLVITLGNTALRAVLGKEMTIGQVHGSSIKRENFSVFPLYHPASIIYNRALKEEYAADLDKLKAILKQTV